VPEVFKPSDIVTPNKHRFAGASQANCYEVLAASYTIDLSSGLILIKDDRNMIAWYPACAFMYSHDLTSLGAQEYEEIMASIGEAEP